MTPRWKAREVFKQVWNNRAKIYNTVFSHFETECGKRFGYAMYWSREYGAYWDRNTQFYVLKHINEHKSVEYRYWIYPIPFERATYIGMDGEVRLDYLHGPRSFVVPK